MLQSCNILMGMTLPECIADMGLTIAEFAKKAGVHAGTIYRLKNGEGTNTETIAKVVAASEGRLTPNDLVACPTQPAA